jgi:uncharacterized protein DUF5675
VKATLFRLPSDQNMGTPGVLQVHDDSGKIVGQFTTGELPWLNNESVYSCVPVGTYQVDWEITGKHPNGIYMLQDVPERTDCEMHNGNFFGNTLNGYRSNVEGCILIATGFGMIEGQLVVVESDIALAAFNTLMGKAPFTLEILSASA